MNVLAERVRAVVFVSVLCAGPLVAGPAFADVITAEVLFNEGRRLLMEGKLDEACDKLAESQRIDPSSGTLLNLALCHERQGKLATAWAEYTAAASLARAQSRPERAQIAEQQAAALLPRLPSITIRVVRQAPGLELARNQERVGVGAIDTAMPVDPGRHVITASAPGHLRWETTIEAAEAHAVEVQVPELLLAAEASPSQAEPTPPPPVPALRNEAEHESVARDRAPDASTGTSLSGWLIAGAGAASLGVGAFLGVQSLRAYDHAEEACPGRTNCDPNAIAEREAAERDAWIANVTVPLGVVGLAVGAYLVLSSGSDPQKSATALSVAPLPSGTMAAWAGTF